MEWFDSYSVDIDQWTSVYGEKEEEAEITTLEPTTIAAETGSTIIHETTKVQNTTSKPSSATSNAYNSLVILQLTVFTVLIKWYLL